MSSSLLEIIGGRPIENNEKEGSSSCSCSCLVFSAVESHNRSIRQFRPRGTPKRFPAPTVLSQQFHHIPTTAELYSSTSIRSSSSVTLACNAFRACVAVFSALFESFGKLTLAQERCASLKLCRSIDSDFSMDINMKRNFIEAQNMDFLVIGQSYYILHRSSRFYLV